MRLYEIRINKKKVYVLDHEDLAAIKQILILAGYDPSECKLLNYVVDPSYTLVPTDKSVPVFRLLHGELNTVYYEI